MPIHAIPRMQLKELTVSGTSRVKEKNFDHGGIRTQDIPITYVLGIYGANSWQGRYLSALLRYTAVMLEAGKHIDLW